MKPIRVALAMVMLFALAACDVGEMLISPDPGEIIDTSTVTVTGQIPIAAEPGGTIDVNGVAGTFTDPEHWEATIPVSPVGYVTVIHVTYTDTNGKAWTQESAVVNGQKIDDGEYSPDGVFYAGFIPPTAVDGAVEGLAALAPLQLRTIRCALFRRLELEAEQRRVHLEVAHLPVDRARTRQRLAILRRELERRLVVHHRAVFAQKEVFADFGELKERGGLRRFVFDGADLALELLDERGDVTWTKALLDRKAKFHTCILTG